MGWMMGASARLRMSALSLACGATRYVRSRGTRFASCATPASSRNLPKRAIGRPRLVMDSAVRVLILTADYGRGHRSAAQALAAAFAQCYRGSVQATVINPLRQPGSSSLPRYAERWYRTMLHAAPWLYDLLYR